MNIISTTGSTIHIAPRYFTSAVKVTIINESTGISIEKQLEMIDNGNYKELDLDFEGKEDNFYLIKVKDSDNDKEIFRGKLYCTNQAEPITYTLNKDSYSTYPTTESGYVFFNQ
jgi:hypothetical protein